MKKGDYIIFSIILAIGITGWFVGRFAGGTMFGAGITMFVLATIGKAQASKAAKAIDKNIRDIIVNRGADE